MGWGRRPVTDGVLNGSWSKGRPSAAGFAGRFAVISTSSIHRLDTGLRREFWLYIGSAAGCGAESYGLGTGLGSRTGRSWRRRLCSFFYKTMTPCERFTSRARSMGVDDPSQADDAAQLAVDDAFLGRLAVAQGRPSVGRPACDRAEHDALPSPSSEDAAVA